MSLVLLAIPLSAAAAFVAAWVASDDESQGGGFDGAVLIGFAALAGATLGALAHSFGAEAATTISFALLGAFLMAGAASDLESGWAPDIATMPVVISAALAGAAPWAWNWSPATGLLVGMVLYMAAQALWMLTREADQAIPPADLLSLLVPILVLGASLRAAGYYLALCLVILLLMRVPRLKAQLQRQKIREAVRAEGAGEAVAEHGIALLAVTYPLLALFCGASVTVFLQG